MAARPLIDSFTVFLEQVGEARSGKTGKVGGKKSGKLVARTELRWVLSATRSLWPAAPKPGSLFNWQE